MQMMRFGPSSSSFDLALLLSELSEVDRPSDQVSPSNDVEYGYTNITAVCLGNLHRSRSLRKVIYTWTLKHEAYRQLFVDLYPDARIQIMAQE
jgi:hypothetical protein